MMRSNMWVGKKALPHRCNPRLYLSNISDLVKPIGLLFRRNVSTLRINEQILLSESANSGELPRISLA